MVLKMEESACRPKEEYSEKSSYIAAQYTNINFVDFHCNKIILISIPTRVLMIRILPSATVSTNCIIVLFV